VVTRDARRCVSLYCWEIPARLEEETVARIVFLFEDGDRVEPHEYRIDFLPFTHAELRERLAEAGLREVDTDFDEDRDQYAVVTVPAASCR
jgi:hypothetical protein